MDRNQEMAEGGKTTESGGRSTEGPGEPSATSPRLIPAPGSPPHATQPSPEMALGATGHSSESFNCKCAPSQAPRCESANYDHLSYDQLREPRKQRGYHKKDAKAALRTRLGAKDSVGRRATEGAANDMDTSSSVSGKRARNMNEPLASEPTQMGINGKRPRKHAPETALAVDMSVVQENAQWRNPAL